MAWHNVARLDALGDGDVIGVEVDGDAHRTLPHR